MKALSILGIFVILGMGMWYAQGAGYIDISHPNSNHPLTSHSWQWEQTSYSNGDTRAPHNPEDFLVRFLADGQFSTGTDCNTAFGSFELNDTHITIGQLGVTEMACSGKTLEKIYLDDIQNIASYQINESGDLELHTNTGALMRFSVY
ncbi:MAG: META domain-containing protein [Patescibacteria group bacterium]